MAHQRRRKIKVEAKVKLTTNHTTPRTASQLTSAITMIIYQGSGCPASSMKVNTAATVKLGSRNGLMKSSTRQNQFLPVGSSNLRSSHVFCKPSRRRFNGVFLFDSFQGILACAPQVCKFSSRAGSYGLSGYSHMPNCSISAISFLLCIERTLCHKQADGGTKVLCTRVFLSRE